MTSLPWKVIRRTDGKAVAQALAGTALAETYEDRGVIETVVAEHAIKRAAEEDAAWRNRVTSAGTTYRTERT